MRRIAILSAAVSGLVASSSFAAFTFTVVSSLTGNGNTRYDVYALNDGAAVGSTIPAGTTKVQAIQYSTETISATGTFKFKFASGGSNVDAYNNRGQPTDVFGDGSLIVPNNMSSLYLATASGDNTYQNATFSPAVTDAASAGAVKSFTLDLAATSNAPLATAAANGGKGALVGSLVTSTGASGTVTGNIAAEAGQSVPYTFNFGSVTTPPTNTPPVVVPAVKTVVFGSNVSTPAAFSATVTVTDVDGGTVSLAAGAGVPASVHGLTITPGSGAAPASFTVSGTVDYAPFGTTVVIPLVGSDGTASSNGTLTLTITPEPASLAALAGAGLMGLVRRRK